MAGYKKAPKNNGLKVTAQDAGCKSHNWQKRRARKLARATWEAPEDEKGIAWGNRSAKRYRDQKKAQDKIAASLSHWMKPADAIRYANDLRVNK